MAVGSSAAYRQPPVGPFPRIGPGDPLPPGFRWVQDARGAFPGPGGTNWVTQAIPGYQWPGVAQKGTAPGASSTTQGGPAGAPNQTPMKVGAGAYGPGAAPTAPAWGAAPTAPAFGAAPGAPTYQPGPSPTAPTAAPAPSPVMTTPPINPLHAAIQRWAATTPEGMQAGASGDDWWSRARAAGAPA